MSTHDMGKSVMEIYESRAVLFICSRECENYIERAIESLICQTFQNFNILLVDDGSTDRTFEIAKSTLERNFRDRFTLVRNQTSVGKSANAYRYLNKAGAVFVAILDGDDAIIDDTILEEYAHAYRDGFDVVWSNYRANDGRIGHCKPLDPAEDPRTQGWRSSHFFSFRHSLFRNIPEHYFKDEHDTWFDCACDFSIAYPILDQTRRYKYIDKIAYEYTVDRALSHHNNYGVSRNINSTRQMKNAQCVLAKKPLPLINPLEGAGPLF